MIKLSYLPNPNSLVRASLLFLEQKIIVKLSIIILNILTIFLASIYLLKFYTMGPLFKEVLLLTASLLWLFGRKPLTISLLNHKMHKNLAIKNIIDIQLSKNGIVWSGNGLKKGNLAWQHVRYLIETKNGFILPNAHGRILWLPLSAFETPQDLNNFKALITHAKVTLKSHKKWVC